jgi:hypothetical protein
VFKAAEKFLEKHPVIAIAGISVVAIAVVQATGGMDKLTAFVGKGVSFVKSKIGASA